MPDEEAVSALYRQLRQLYSSVRLLPVTKQLPKLGRAQRDAMNDILSSLDQALRLARDAGKSEDDIVILSSLKRCQEQLDMFQEALLAASGYDIVDSVDVAHLSALGSQIHDQLRPLK